MKYQIIQSTDGVADLENEVAKEVERGWVPLGAPTISISESDTYYYFNGFQAMVLHEDCKNESRLRKLVGAGD